MALFSNLNKDTIGKACRWFLSRLVDAVEANADFFEYI